MTRVHLLAPPNAQTTPDYPLCGFTVATRRFVTLLKSIGCHVTLYASEENNTPCDELVTVITKEEQESILGNAPYQLAMIEQYSGLWALSNARSKKEIAKRKVSRDLILTIGGIAQKEVADYNPDLQCVEYSIGYVSSFAPYRVYESRVWQHCSHGYQGNLNGCFFDTVIPMFFPVDEFQFNPDPEPFALYVGRLVPLKGLDIACQSAHAAGIPLKVIGHGDPNIITHGAEYLGPLDSKTRNELMGRAGVVLSPTKYIEPFGAVAVEAQLCGTPVVATNFGGFTETVEQGKTGFLCNYLGEFVEGIKKSASLSRSYIRDRAIKTYSIEAIAPMYRSYFDRLSLLFDKGWNTL